jgi:hypothetical protein
MQIAFRPRGGLWQIGRHRQLCVNTRARAIGDAMPLLVNAGRVEVVIVTNENSTIDPT